MRSPRRSFEISIVLFSLILAQIPFVFGAWVSDFNAPYTSGEHNLVITVEYGNLTGTYPVGVTVYEYVLASLGLSVRPLPQLEDYPPILLKYEITLNSQPVQSLLTSTVGLFLTYEDVTLASTASPLEGSDGIFSTLADVPFKGEYTAQIYIEVEEDAKIYGGTFISTFYSGQASPNLEIIPYLEHRVFTPREVFEAMARIRFKEVDIEGSNLLRAALMDADSSLDWDDSEYIYRTSLTAPGEEGIYKTYFYAVGQEFFETEFVYIVDPTKEKSEICPVIDGRSCNYPTEARRCFVVYRSGESFMSEDQLIECILDAGYPEAIEFYCNSSAVGDLDSDGKLDPDDVYVLSEYILAIPEHEERQQYVSCADFNLDLIVDEKDSECLGKVVTGEWLGDIGGGICIDFDISSNLYGDLDADVKITAEDVSIMDELIRVGDKVEMPQEVLDHVDFNQDGVLTYKDLECLEAFNGLELGAREGFTITEQIPSECMAIYHLDECRNVRGDLNGDIIIDEIDEILIMMANRELIASDLVYINCADVNKDERLTTEDEICVKEYVSGNRDKYFACIDCPDSLPSEFFSFLEICNDGWDNDCDGLIDRTDLDPAEDWCQCNEETPCEMQYNPTGGITPGGSPTGMQFLGGGSGAGSGYYVCRDVGWDSTGYFWMSPVPCTGQVECDTTACAGRTNKCAHDGTKFDWRPQLVMPKETDDPGDSPRTCQDGHDNDCQGGDEKCEEEEDIMMWVMVGIAAVSVILQALPAITSAFKPAANAAAPAVDAAANAAAPAAEMTSVGTINPNTGILETWTTIPPPVTTTPAVSSGIQPLRLHPQWTMQ